MMRRYIRRLTYSPPGPFQIHCTSASQLLGLDRQIQTATFGFALGVDGQIHDREQLEGLFSWKCLKGEYL